MVLHTKNKLITITILLFLLLSAPIFAGEQSNTHKFALQVDKNSVPSPIYTKNKPFKGDDLLLVQLFERQKPLDGQSRTKFYMLNPAEKEVGFIQILEGPGEDQYFNFHTPLFNGWGIAYGKVNEKIEPQWPELFWFNAITGDKGPIIHKGSYGEFIFKEDLIFFSNEGLNRYNIKSGELVHIPIKSLGRFQVISPNEVIKNDLIFFSNNGLYRYHLESEELFYIPIKLITYQIISPHKLFAEIDEENEGFLIELDILTFNINKITKIPTVVNTTKTKFPYRYIHHIGMAGKEGVFIVNGYSLWFKPNNGEWRNVINNVSIHSKFGASIPYLPVSYLGNGKFAVTKSVEKKDKDQLNDPEYLSVTMLIDGYTSKIIKETKPIIYEENPRSNIPDHWLTEEQAKRRKEYLKNWEINNKKKSNHTIQLDQGHKLEKFDKVVNSKSDKFIAIYRNWSSHWAEDANYLNFKIIEKQTGKSRDFRINTSKKVLCVKSCDWLMMMGSEFNAEILEKERLDNLESISYSWHDPMVWDPAIH